MVTLYKLAFGANVMLTLYTKVTLKNNGYVISRFNGGP